MASNSTSQKQRKKTKRFGFLILLITFCCLLMWIYRNQVSLVLAEKYATPILPIPLKFECLEWQLQAFNNIKIDRVCLSHPLATLELHNITVDNIEKPQHINIGSLQVNSLQPIQSLISTQQKQQKTTIEQQLQQLFEILEPLKQFAVPYHIKLQNFQLNNKQQAVVKGQLAITPTTIQLELDELLQLSYQPTQQGFDVNLDFYSGKIIEKLQQHQISMPDLIEQHPIATSIKAQIQLQDQQLKIQHQIAPFNWQGPNQLAANFNQGIKGQLTLTPKSINWQNPSQATQWQLVSSNRLEQLKLNQQLQTLLASNDVSQFNLTLPANSQLHYHANKLKLDSINIENPQHQITLNKIEINSKTLDTTTAITLTSTLKLPQLKQYSQQPIKIDLNGQITWQQETLQSQLAVNSTLTQVNIKNNNTTAQFDQIDIAIQQQGQLYPFNDNENIPLDIKSQIILDTLKVADIQLTGNSQIPQLSIKATQLALTELLRLNITQPIEHQVISGQLSYQLQGPLQGAITELKPWHQQALTLSLKIEDVSAEIDDIWLQQANFEHQFQLNQGKLQTIKQTTPNFTLELIELGTPITKLQAKVDLNLDLVQSGFSVKVNNGQGKMFDGQFKIDQFNWPPEPRSQVTLKLENLDLEKIVALEKKQGIEVTGRISGSFPTSITQAQDKSQPLQVTIDDGELHNTTDGVIKIKDSPAVQRLKQSRDDLKLAFEALENLQYHQLDAIVTMTPDGQMYLQTVIKGRNPDLDNEVNFNLGLDYDLIGLLQSMFISQKLEQQIQQKMQQN